MNLDGEILQEKDIFILLMRLNISAFFNVHSFKFQ